METASIPPHAHTTIANKLPKSDKSRMDNGTTLFNGNISTAQNPFPQVAGNCRLLANKNQVSFYLL